MSQWAAVLAGGSGTRFWPLSTPARPKQLLPLAGDRPLLCQAVDRLAGVIPTHQILIITGASLADAIRRLLPGIPPENVLAEPRAASTGPALTWATWVAAGRDADACVLSLHADWHVGDDALFRETARRALEAAQRFDVLVTVGVVPTRPDVGYGYIEPGATLDEQVRSVERFVEKPPAARAGDLIANGALWNSGLFAWTARRFLEETRAVAPEIAVHVSLLDQGDIEGFFGAVTPIAIDVSHFERSRRVAVIPGRFPWDDVGTWTALRRLRRPDAAGNVTVGDVVVREAGNCLAWADDGAIVVDGVHDLVIVRANGVTLVTTGARAEHLKALLDQLPERLRRLERADPHSSADG